MPRACLGTAAVQSFAAWIALMDTCTRCHTLQVLNLKGCSLGDLSECAGMGPPRSPALPAL